MASAQERTKSLIDEQVQQRDPFEKLSQARSKRAQEGPVEQVLSESAEARNTDPRNPLGNLVEGRSKVLSESNSPTLRQFLSGADEQAQEKFDSSSLKGHFGKLGLGELSEGLSFNGFGKLQLMLRLRDKYGDGFFEVPEARSALTAFEQALKQSTDSDKESFNKSMSNADRTLDVLLGGDS